MNAALAALGGTVAANVPGCTKLLTDMLTVEHLAAGMTNVIDTRERIPNGSKQEPERHREFLAFPALRRASCGAAEPFDIASLGTTDLTGVCRTSHTN